MRPCFNETKRGTTRGESGRSASGVSRVSFGFIVLPIGYPIISQPIGRTQKNKIITNTTIITSTLPRRVVTTSLVSLEWDLMNTLFVVRLMMRYWTESKRCCASLSLSVQSTSKYVFTWKIIDVWPRWSTLAVTRLYNPLVARGVWSRSQIIISCSTAECDADSRTLPCLGKSWTVFRIVYTFYCLYERFMRRAEHRYHLQGYQKKDSVASYYRKAG